MLLVVCVFFLSKLCLNYAHLCSWEIVQEADGAGLPTNSPPLSIYKLSVVTCGRHLTLTSDFSELETSLTKLPMSRSDFFKLNENFCLVKLVTHYP